MADSASVRRRRQAQAEARAHRAGQAGQAPAQGADVAPAHRPDASAPDTREVAAPPPASATISSSELSRNINAVLNVVGDGATIEITRYGKTAAYISMGSDPLLDEAIASAQLASESGYHTAKPSTQVETFTATSPDLRPPSAVEPMRGRKARR